VKSRVAAITAASLLGGMGLTGALAPTAHAATPTPVVLGSVLGGGSGSGYHPASGVKAAALGGYDLVGSDGGVFAFGSGSFSGSLPGLGVHVNNIVGIVPSATDNGYFLVGSDGGVFSFGNTTFEGSLPGIGVNVNNIVGIVPSSDDRGYFLVGTDGGVFAFGDSTFEGSLPGNGISVNDVAGIAGTPDNQGYWVLEQDGNISNFGTAQNFGSLTATNPCAGVVGCTVIPNNPVAIVSTSDGQGWWVVSNLGQVISGGDAQTFGEDFSGGTPSVSDIVSLVPTADDQGYWLIGKNGSVDPFGDAASFGSLPSLGVPVNNIVGAVPTA
jgi:hypothetical protein